MKTHVAITVALIEGAIFAGDHGATRPQADTVVEELEVVPLSPEEWMRLLSSCPSMEEIPDEPPAPRRPATPDEERLVREAPPQWHGAILDSAAMSVAEVPLDFSRGTVFWDMPWQLIAPPSGLEESGPLDSRERREIRRQQDAIEQVWEAMLLEFFGAEPTACVANVTECAASAFVYCEERASKMEVLAYVAADAGADAGADAKGEAEGVAQQIGCFTRCRSGKQGVVKLCNPF